jgi:hypothetical protein
MKHGSITSIQNKKRTEHAVETPGSSPPKKFKRVSSAGKMMASILWDSQGIIMTDFL